MHEHYAEAFKEPDLIAVAPGLACLRFESMKVYSALGAVRHLLETGAVEPGGTLVDSSSGIYAHALALACHRYGMRCHIVGSTTIDPAMSVQLRLLGATMEQVPASTDLKFDQSRRVRRIAELLAENPGHHWMRQYHDDVHYLGYREVAARIAAEVPEGPLGLVGGVGSGASTGALASYLREGGRDVRLVGVQPFGSITFDGGHVADPDMIIAGIGSSIPFDNVHHDLYDRVHWVSFRYASAASLALLRETGVFAGLSSGASFLAATWESAPDPERTYVFIAPDTGHRYVDSVYARHADIDADVGGIADLRPHEIASTADLAGPWSAVDWPTESVPAASPTRATAVLAAEVAR